MLKTNNIYSLLLLIGNRFYMHRIKQDLSFSQENLINKQKYRYNSKLDFFNSTEIDIIFVKPKVYEIDVCNLLWQTR